MTHLTNEQQALIVWLLDESRNGNVIYDEDGASHDYWEIVHTLGRQRAAHQATRSELEAIQAEYDRSLQEMHNLIALEREIADTAKAELEQLRKLQAAVQFFLESPMHGSDIALIAEAYRESYDATRAGQGEGAG